MRCLAILLCSFIAVSSAQFVQHPYHRPSLAESLSRHMSRWFGNSGPPPRTYNPYQLMDRRGPLPVAAQARPTPPKAGRPQQRRPQPLAPRNQPLNLSPRNDERRVQQRGPPRPAHPHPRPQKAPRGLTHKPNKQHRRPAAVQNNNEQATQTRPRITNRPVRPPRKLIGQFPAKSGGQRPKKFVPHHGKPTNQQENKFHRHAAGSNLVPAANAILPQLVPKLVKQQQEQPTAHASQPLKTHQVKTDVPVNATFVSNNATLEAEAIDEKPLKKVVKKDLKAQDYPPVSAKKTAKSPAGHKPHGKVVNSAPVAPQAPQNRDYKASQPKYIIKQAGPSQQFGWLGHGHYVPTFHVPNIFRQVGLNTAWIPQKDAVFEAGLLYPEAPASNSYNPSPVASSNHGHSSSSSSSSHGHSSSPSSTAGGSSYSAPDASNTYSAPSNSATNSYSSPSVVAVPDDSYSAPSVNNPVASSINSVANSYSPPFNTGYAAPPAATTTASPPPTYGQVFFTSTGRPVVASAVYVPTTSRPAAPINSNYEPVSVPVYIPSTASPYNQYSFSTTVRPAPPQYGFSSSSSGSDYLGEEAQASDSNESVVKLPIYYGDVKSDIKEKRSKLTRPNLNSLNRLQKETSAAESQQDLTSSRLTRSSTPAPESTSRPAAASSVKPFVNFGANKSASRGKLRLGYSSTAAPEVKASPAPSFASPSPSESVQTPSPSFASVSPSYASPSPSYASPAYGSPSPSPSPAPFVSFGGGASISSAGSSGYKFPTAGVAGAVSPSPSPSPSPAPFTAFGGAADGSIKPTYSKYSSGSSTIVDLAREPAHSPQDPVDENGDDVFYIFYEKEKNQNEHLALVPESGYSGEIFQDDSIPTFSVAKPPVTYDIPLKVEESGEGFTPPTIQDIRTIYVPVENAINVPETYELSVGTSFGFKGGKNNNQRPVRKIRRPARKPSRPEKTSQEDAEEDEALASAALPYGSRLTTSTS